MQSLRAPERLPYARPAPRPRDPAPTRLAYRIERLRLTPHVRTLVRIGLPSALLLLSGLAYLGDSDRRAALSRDLAELRTSFEQRPEFMVRMLAVNGATPPVDSAVRTLLALDLPVSSFRLDLEAMRATIEGIDAVAGAELRIRSEGILEVAVTERVPVVLAATAAGLQMLDATGHRVATLLDRNARPDLPVIAGEGAGDQVQEALVLFAAATPILDRVRGIVRMGERRWDVVLNHGQRILLPEEGAVEALQRAIALDAAEDIFGRDLVQVDLRKADRPTIRLTEAAITELRKKNQIDVGVTAND